MPKKEALLRADRRKQWTSSKPQVKGLKYGPLIWALTCFFFLAQVCSVGPGFVYGGYAAVPN